MFRVGVPITREMIERASIEAEKREPHIKHHFNVEHLSGDLRNEIGFLGEFACCELLGIDWRSNIRKDYLTIDNGDIRVGNYLIDVKTETIPQPYFDQVINRRVDDDYYYGRRLIVEGQVGLLSKYDIVVFGGFVRDNYKKWYALGYIDTKKALNYKVVENAPFGVKYPEPAIPIKTSDLYRMDRLIAYADRIAKHVQKNNE